MLDHLLETGARRKKSTSSILASAVAHGALVCLAVAGTMHAKPGPATATRERPVLIPTFTPPVGRPVSGHSETGGAATRSDVPRIPLPGPIDIETPLHTPLVGSGDDSEVLRELSTTGAGLTTAVGSSSGPSASAQLDTPVRVLDERVPTYPPSLRSIGITGHVTAQFVVDTTGRVEAGSLRILSATHELFAQSVAASLRYTRFTPGELSGRKVRTLVERSFRFDIGGRDDRALGRQRCPHRRRA